MCAKKLSLKGPVTVGDVEEILNDLEESGILYREDIEGLARRFLDIVLPIEAMTASFEVLHNTYLEEAHEKRKRPPKDPREFYQYIVELYLVLKSPPGGALLDLFQRATMHIRDIDERLGKIKEEIDQVRRGSIAEKHSKWPVLEYFQKLNQAAKEEILNFMKGAQIYQIAKNRSHKYTTAFQWFNQVPYAYEWNPQNYEVKYPSLIDNKFGDLPIQEYNKVRELYSRDRSAFRSFLSDYIDQSGTLLSLREAYHYSHIIAQRSETIEATLLAFEFGNKIVFSSACILQIEGIIGDICLDFGYSDDDYQSATFQKKLDFLEDRLGFDLHYQYFAFQFRLIRNRAGHGRMEAQEAKEIAELLLLDLLSCVEMCKSMSIPVNQKRFLLHQTLKDPPPEKFNYLIGYVLLGDQSIPDFYKSDEDHLKLIQVIESKEFWDSFAKLMEDEVNLPMGKTFLQRLKVLGVSSADAKCKEWLKKLNKINPREFDQKQFIYSLLGH